MAKQPKENLQNEKLKQEQQRDLERQHKQQQTLNAVNSLCVGDPIQIISGAFAGLRGTLLDVNLKRQEVKVAICLFDRETEAVLRIDEVV